MAIADCVLAIVNSRPSTGAIKMNISGSIGVEPIQKAMTGASGAPAPSRPTMIDTTPQEQNVDNAPNRAATTITVARLPPTTTAIWRSKPVALAPAATATETIRNGAMNNSDPATNLTLGTS